MVSMYDKVAIECDKDEGLFTIFKDRLYSIVQESDGIGWGYHDALCDIFFSIEWVQEDE